MIIISNQQDMEKRRVNETGRHKSTFVCHLMASNPGKWYGQGVQILSVSVSPHIKYVWCTLYGFVLTISNNKTCVRIGSTK